MPKYTIEPLTRGTRTAYTIEAPSTPDFPSNPNGEGLYRMGSYDFQEGSVSKPEIKVPFKQGAECSQRRLQPPSRRSTSLPKGRDASGARTNPMGARGFWYPEAIDAGTTETGQARSIRHQQHFSVQPEGYSTALRNTSGTSHPPTRRVLPTGNTNELLELNDPAQMPKALIDQYQADRAKDPRLAIQNLVGSIIGAGATVAADHGATKVVGAGPGADGDGEASREGALRFATRTGPSVTRQVIADTAKENEKLRNLTRRLQQWPTHAMRKGLQRIRYQCRAPCTRPLGGNRLTARL